VEPDPPEIKVVGPRLMRPPMFRHPWSDDVRFMLDLLGPLSLWLPCVELLLILHVTHIIHPSSLPLDQIRWCSLGPLGSFGGVPYRAPVKRNGLVV